MNSVSLCSQCGNTFSFNLEHRPSDVLDFLRENYIPGPVDAANYRHSVVKAEMDLSKLDRTIEDISAILKQLQATRQDIGRYVEIGSTLMSPIRRMPNEMLEAIFDHLAGVISLSNGQFRKRPDVWVVRQVCKKWKDVVDSKTSYWTQLSFYESRGGYAKAFHAVDNSCFMTLLGSLSGNAPLRVELDFSKYTTEEFNRSITDFVRTNAHKIRSLDLTPWTIPDIANVDELPLLEDLRIADVHWESVNRHAFTLSIVQCFRKSPRLRSVELIINTVYPELELPWASLQKISLYTSEDEHLALLLRDHCQSLTSLKWRYPSFTNDAFLLAAGNLCFSNVEKFVLVLNTDSCHKGAVVLVRFQFPVLKELEMITVGMDVPDGKAFQMSFLTFLLQHSPTLKCLRLTNIPSLGASELLAMLAVLPRLRCFTYSLMPDYDYDMPSFYDLLTSKSDELVPELEDLEIEGDELVIDSAVLDGLEIRRRDRDNLGGGPLKQLSLTFKNIEFRGNVLPRLESLRRDGLVVGINGVYANWH